MSTNDDKRLVRQYYEEIVSTGAIDEIERFVSPDYVEVHDNERHPIGVDGAKEHIRGRSQYVPGPPTDGRAADRRGRVGRVAGNDAWDAQGRVARHPAHRKTDPGDRCQHRPRGRRPERGARRRSQSRGASARDRRHCDKPWVAWSRVAGGPCRGGSTRRVGSARANATGSGDARWSLAALTTPRPGCASMAQARRRAESLRRRRHE